MPADPPLLGILFFRPGNSPPGYTELAKDFDAAKQDRIEPQELPDLGRRAVDHIARGHG
jgi:hypothetical protein